MTKIDKSRIQAVLSRATARGAAAAEVYFRSSTGTSVEVKDRAVDAFERAADQGIGLRLLMAERIGFAYTTDFGEASLNALVDAAVDNARGTEPDPFSNIPDRSAAPYPEVSIYDPQIPVLTEKEKIDRVLSLERSAFGVDPRVKRIRKAQASFSESETSILNSRGAEVSFRGTAVSASIEVVAEEKGEAQAGWEYDVKRFYRSIDIDAVGRKAAQKALDLLGARHIDSVKAPVILDPSVAEEFLSILAGGFSADSVQKKKSLFIGKLGRPVASPLVTVVDDGLLEGGLGTAPSDDELTAVSKKTVIDGGVLSLYLHNSYTARKDKTVSTGNGMRPGFKGVPGVSVTNLYIQPGTQKPDEMIASLDKGVLVTEVMGMHTANPISGDFSVGATGFWIEKGKKAFPVREITIAGNILDLMKNVAVVGSDLRFAGRIGSPSLLVKELSIAGK